MLAHEESSWRGRLRAREASERRSAPRGRLVEFVRLIFVTLFAAAGYTVATRVATSPSQTLAYVVLGTSTGFVLGGVLGPADGHGRALDGGGAPQGPGRRDRRRCRWASWPGSRSRPCSRSPCSGSRRSRPGPAWRSRTSRSGYVGFRIGRTKHEELFGLIGLKPRAAGKPEKVFVVDTSALIDGRILDLVATGFLSGDLLDPHRVLRELQTIADSSDPRRRARGRRGLDAVVELKRAATVEVHLVEEDGGSDVDALLVRLARERGASLVTTDHNLSKVAEAVGVPVPRLNDLAAAFRLPVGIGDEIDVHLVKPGREAGQAVGYLDDGTMVVVEAAGERIGSDTPIVVRNVIKTATGRMVFANLQ